MLNQTGFGWNAESNTVIVEEETLKNYIKVNIFHLVGFIDFL